MLGLGLHDQGTFLVGDAAGKSQPDLFSDGRPDFNTQNIVVPRHGFVTQPAFDDREDRILFLPFEQRAAELAEEFTARSLQQVEIAAIIDMVADSAFSVSDTVLVAENGCGHGGKSNGPVKKRE